MRTRTLAVGLVAALMLSGCSQPLTSPPPAQTQTPLAVDEVASLSGSRAEVFESLTQAMEASETVVVARVTGNLGQLDKYPLPATESEVEVIQTLKGDAQVGSTARVMEIGNDKVRIEGDGPPLAEGTTYLLFLRSLGSFTADSGEEVDASDIHTTVMPAHYVVQGDQLTLDLPNGLDDVPQKLTHSELAAELAP